MGEGSHLRKGTQRSTGGGGLAIDPSKDGGSGWDVVPWRVVRTVNCS
jgi:hypothetical protein